MTAAATAATAATAAALYSLAQQLHGLLGGWLPTTTTTTLELCIWLCTFGLLVLSISLAMRSLAF